MFIHLARQSNQALYLQVADQLRTKIENGELSPQMRLPASRVLAKKLGVNRITIVNAYAELEAEGLVVSRTGSGTFVATHEAGDTTLADSYHPPLWSTTLPARSPQSANQMVAEMMRLSRQPGVISFAGGAPADEFLPVNEFRRALNEVLRHDGAEALQYEEAAGYFPLRAYLAAQLQETQTIRINPNEILITAGCQQAVDIVLRVLARGENHTIIVEDPCYLGLLDQVSSRRITPIGVPMDEYGMQVERVESLILRHRPRLIFVTPTFHNPTGRTMPLERRQTLIEIAARYGVPILEDATYDALRYEDDPVPTLKSLDTADIVFHAGGYSKTLAPGIRIGYLLVPGLIYERIIAAKQTTDIMTAPLNQRALYTYLQSGHFADHLEQVRGAYQERRDAMLAAAEKYLPAAAQWRKPGGGIYLWVEMPPEGPTATDLYLTAINYNVAFAIGSVFSASNSYRHALRLNFAGHPPQMIAEGMRRLGKAWNELLARYNHHPNGSDGHRPAVHIL
jgi:DNA-binding transcriptional MocR family regulator